MFNLAIDSKLRGCDVVALKVEDVAPNGYTIDRATIRQRKTGRPVKFELTEQTREAVDGYLRAFHKDKEVWHAAAFPDEISNLDIGSAKASAADWRTARSKRIGSDARIHALAQIIRKTAAGFVETVLIGPQRYNELYEKFGNLNKLLGWGHARVIENLVEKKPDCPRSLSDQFADPRVIEQSLLRHGRKIDIEQRTRAESDIAVAAASILAREAFINWLERRGKELGLRLERGVSPAVKEAAKNLVQKSGPEALRDLAKVHFRTAHEIAPDHYPAPPPRQDWRR